MQQVKIANHIDDENHHRDEDQAAGLHAQGLAGGRLAGLLFGLWIHLAHSSSPASARARTPAPPSLGAASAGRDATLTLDSNVVQSYVDYAPCFRRTDCAVWDFRSQSRCGRTAEEWGENPLAGAAISGAGRITGAARRSGNARRVEDAVVERGDLR